MDHDNFQRKEGMFQKNRASEGSYGKGQRETNENGKNEAKLDKYIGNFV